MSGAGHGGRVGRMMLRHALQTVRDRKAGFLRCLRRTAVGGRPRHRLRDAPGDGTPRKDRHRALRGYADPRLRRPEGPRDTVKEKKDGRTKTKTKHKAKPVAERAVPELTFQAVPLVKAPGKPLPSYGHAWSSAAPPPFTLTEGRAPQTGDEVVVDRAPADRAGLRPGPELPVQCTGEPRTYRVSGVARTDRGDLSRQSALFFGDDGAQRPAARVERALRGTTAQVAAGDERGPVEFLDAAGARIKLVSVGGAMGGTSLLAGGLRGGGGGGRGAGPGGHFPHGAGGFAGGAGGCRHGEGVAPRGAPGPGSVPLERCGPGAGARAAPLRGRCPRAPAPQTPAGLEQRLTRGRGWNSASRAAGAGWCASNAGGGAGTATHASAGLRGRPADFQAWKPPVRSVALWRPRAWSEAAARLDA